LVELASLAIAIAMSVLCFGEKTMNERIPFFLVMVEREHVAGNMNKVT